MPIYRVAAGKCIEFSAEVEALHEDQALHHLLSYLPWNDALRGAFSPSGKDRFKNLSIDMTPWDVSEPCLVIPSTAYL